ncbi:NADH-quinone oxidoreductase subunit NuoB [Actinoallomurus soli]|nr:NADH-quinone oxidoreductase subunit NuoB [Actinoallomurus soli]
MGAVDLPEPRIGPASRLAPKPIKFVLNWGRRYSLWVFNFGLACCAIEFIATSMSRHDFIRLGVIPFAPGPRQADLMVVSGTVSDKMAPAVKRLYEQMPEPKYVISFGACSNCGGPYWDSYCVTKGVDQIIPVDVYVPGCPPRPEALLHGILKLQEKIAAESLGDRYTGNGEAVAPPPPVVRRPPTPAVLRRPLVLPPVPEPEEIEAAEQPTQKFTALSEDVAATGTQELPPAAVPAPENDRAVTRDSTETQDLPVPELPASGEPSSAAAETQELPTVDPDPTPAPPSPGDPDVADRPTEVLPPVPDASTTQDLPTPKDPGTTQELPVPDESDRPAETPPSAKGPDEPTEVLPTVDETAAEEPAGDAGREKTATERPSGGSPAEGRRRRLGGRLRRIAEPPPVLGDTDHTIIPGLSDDD